MSPFETQLMQRINSPEAQAMRMLAFEAALARAEAAAGVIPANAAEQIEKVCLHHAETDFASVIDLVRLQRDAVTAGNLAIPFVKQLTAKVAESDAEAARFVHWGSTSQDVLDTALVMQLRAATLLLASELNTLCDAVASLVERHANTAMAGRTLLQQALPITFGAKAAGWLDALGRHHERLMRAHATISVLQFGGAAGTLASLGDRAGAVAQALAEELALALPAVPWHSHRDRVVEVATVCGLLVGTLGKIARDIELAAQTEVGELREPAAPGKGGSSTLPHKRNPVACTYVVAAATRMPGLVATMLSAMLQEHERAAGAWQAEWDVMPEILQLTAASLAHLHEVAAGLEIDTARMRVNLDLTQGQLMAEAVTLTLGAALGRMAAHERVQAACQRATRNDVPLRDELLADEIITHALSVVDIDRLLDPANYLGQSSIFAKRVLAEHRERGVPNDATLPPPNAKD
jgi:3-carboxy-cis,cis-muconate cycloisomerase